MTAADHGCDDGVISTYDGWADCPVCVAEEIGPLRAECDALRALVDAVRREHAARAAWLSSLPEGTCANPPPRELLDAEDATRAALRELEK